MKADFENTNGRQLPAMDADCRVNKLKRNMSESRLQAADRYFDRHQIGVGIYKVIVGIGFATGK